MDEKKAGRHRVYQEAPMERVTVRLPHLHIRRMRKLGDGDVSAGIRKAIEAAIVAMAEFDAQVKPPDT